MLIIAGRLDWAVPPVNAGFLHDHMPKSQLEIINAGNFTGDARRTSTPRS